MGPPGRTAQLGVEPINAGLRMQEQSLTGSAASILYCADVPTMIRGSGTFRN